MLTSREQYLILIAAVATLIGFLINPLLTLDLTLVTLFLLAIVEFGFGRLHTS